MKEKEQEIIDAAERIKSSMITHLRNQANEDRAKLSVIASYKDVLLAKDHLRSIQYENR